MATESVATEDSLSPEVCASFDFDALLTADQVKEIDANSESWGPNRRLVLATLTSSKAQLLERCDEGMKSADTYFELLEHIRKYKGQLKAWDEQAQAAEVRVLCILGSLHERVSA